MQTIKKNQRQLQHCARTQQKFEKKKNGTPQMQHNMRQEQKQKNQALKTVMV